MLILFHCLSLLIFQLLRNRKRKKFLQSVAETKSQLNTTSSVNADLEFNLKFEPPVYRQRYGRVYETLLDERWRKGTKKLVDFGCSEFGVFVFLKRLSSLNHIFFIDIDEEMLKEHQGKLYPLTIEYLKRREAPLEINVFAGSVGDPDYRLVNTDAVTAIELIEHLYPDVLEAFPYNIFSFIEPKVVIVTTPNSDFNVLFSKNVTRFRHYDHKFEWSREQFEEWATNITIRFPDYTVSFSGIGEGPEGTEALGQCSQMAVFVRKDILDDKYMSSIYATACICSSSSPCKGVTSQTKLLCKCICALCLPNASYGICTYYSYSKQIISYEIENDGEQNPSYDIYYNCIEKILYPFDNDKRTEEQKMLDEFKYRINSFGQSWGRFFVEERNRSEIPLMALIYGPQGCFITEPELQKLLTKSGYQIEECRIQETGLIEKCVIYEPEMEEISSTSEASGYDSDFTKYQLNEESFSDWDEPYGKKETGKPSGSSKDMSCLEMTSREDAIEITDVEEDKKQQDSLFDSGYQKSLSLVDDSPQTPLEELEETDLFEDTTSTPSLSSEDNKVHLKRANLEKQSFAPAPPDFNKFKLDLNRINEMDKFHIHNMPPGRTFYGHFLAPPEVVKKSFLKDKDSMPGPSDVQGKKRKKFKKTLSIHSDEDSPLDDVKSITNCIIENTLNRIVVNEENDEQNDLIEYAAPEPQPELEAEHPAPVNDAPLDAPVVENGDLANNNRDIEGNNYIAQEEAEDNIGNDIANDNFEANEEVPQIQEENANIDNNNAQAGVLQVIEDPPVLVEEPVNVENAENVQVENEIAQASREALFDPNSEHDLLDVEIPAPLDEDDIFNIMNMHNNMIVIGVHPPQEDETGFPVDHNGFPNWLLQILGAQVTIEGEAPVGSLEEPHFYCQGDGLGVHPSVIAVEIDEEEDEDSESSNNTDFAEVDPGVSSQDMSSLLEDSQANGLEAQEILLETEEDVGPTTSEQDGQAEPSSSSQTGTSRSN